MKTLNIIKKVVLVSMVVVLMSTSLDGQKSYYYVSFERGITEFNKMANSLIEKYKIKFDLNNAVKFYEMKTASEVMAENELNGLIDILSENSKFDVNCTISVTDANEENSELNPLTDELMESIKFDADQTILVTEAVGENTELNLLTDEQMKDMKFDVNQSISVKTEGNELVF